MMRSIFVVSHMVECCAQSMLRLLVLPASFAQANQDVISERASCLAGTFRRLCCMRSRGNYGSTGWLLVNSFALSAMLRSTADTYFASVYGAS